MIHLLGMKKSWSRQRLIPTAMCTAITMIHFHSVFWRSPVSYPLFNYFPVLLESLLVTSTILVCALDALTQIFLEGAVTRNILCRGGSLIPRLEEDCSVVIARLGIASLEATSVAGLGNEVAGVTVFDTLLQGFGDDINDDLTAMELDRAGISSPGDLALGRHKGFLNEVRNIKATSTNHLETVESRSLLSKEMERYLKAWLRVLKGVWILLRYGKGSLRGIPTSAPVGDEVAETTVPAEEDGDDYRRFLLGETISDDEEEYNLSPHTPSSSRSVSDDEEDDSPAELYQNLASGKSSLDPVPVLLAHMVDSSSFPLTRRRYQRFIASAGQPETPTVESRVGLRMSSPLNELSEENGWDENRMACVICTARPRQVICWPCR